MIKILLRSFISHDPDNLNLIYKIIYINVNYMILYRLS